MLITMHSRQHGYSLIELMLTLTLGMIVVGGALAMYMSTFSANSSALKIARLNSELRSAMAFVTRDLKRAGYWNGADAAVQNNTLQNNPFFTTDPVTRVSTNTANDSPAVTYECILFSYDLNSNGAFNSPDEALGYRHDNAKKAIEVRRSAKNCAETGWEDLSDPDVIEITKFEILDMSPGAVSVTNGATTTTIQQRQFTIEITGRLKADTSVQRTIRETVRLRNERVTST